MKKYKLLVICGKAGSGKNYFVNKLLEGAAGCLQNVIHWVVADTTRPPRINEKDGVDYNFLPSNLSPLSIISNKQYIEVNYFNDWFYGTPLDALELDKINILITSPNGIEQLSDLYNLLDMHIFSIYQPSKIRLLNQLNRENNPDCSEICRRFLADEKDFLILNDYFFHRINLYENSTQDMVEKILKHIQTWYIAGQN